MMKPVYRIDFSNANPVDGRVVYDFPKATWNLGMVLGALVFSPSTISIELVLLLSIMTYFSLLIGHSVGMHRMMIHGTFETYPVLEKMLIYIGVLVGLSGPCGIIRIHDVRDWAQRQKQCHVFFSHKTSYFNDVWWQLTSKFEFNKPPKVMIEPKFSRDAFYQHLERYWRAHQVMLGVAFYFLGGWPLVIWGVFVRVSISVIGHWTITYFCHNPGPGVWRVRNAAVQASNIPGLGIITYGECWHNNHHAFPESARIGLEAGQSDPSWRFIQVLQFLGLAWNIGKPRPVDQRNDLYQSS